MTVAYRVDHRGVIAIMNVLSRAFTHATLSKTSFCFLGSFQYSVSISKLQKVVARLIVQNFY